MMLKSSFVFRFSFIIVFLHLKNKQPKRLDDACDITVAIAAPFTPKSNA
jgi:hypothetical protein